MSKALTDAPRSFARRNLGPLALLLTTPPFAMTLWYVHARLDGSIGALVGLVGREGVGGLLAKAWWPHFWGSPTGWAILGVFTATQLALLRWLPAKQVAGPQTPGGYTPKYRANGPAALGITLALYLLAVGPLGLVRPGLIYDHLGDVFGALTLFSLVFCLGLYVKGRFAPTSADSGSSGSFIFDYYWGTELHPRIFGFDVKQVTNCRIGMMGWAVLIVAYAAKEVEMHGRLSPGMATAVGLQLVYITKFFFWEMGYMRTLDIMHDRAGFYICWGCLVWVPTVYTSSTLFLVPHTSRLSAPAAVLIFALGAGAILINYLADLQRQRFREAKGAMRIWGDEPRYVVASYRDHQGERRNNLLLASGWWGIARHFHYVPEILAAFLWASPALFTHALPYFYVLFLTLLLTDRALRDDRRCANKYGTDWRRYQALVPYRMVPGLF